MAAGNLWINLGLRTQAFDRNLNRSSQRLRRFGGDVKGFNKTLMGLSRAAGFAGGAYGLGMLAKSFLNSGSIAEETQAKFDTVFKDLADGANRWADTFGDSVGRASQDVKSWMATLQDTFVPLGIARNESAELAKNLVKLGVDVASFNNKADADVIRDFTSALVGNHETVRKYGILISETSIKQEALRQGWQKSYSQLTDLEKVQLRYNIIQNSTTDAQGDALRTADSYANQVKRLSANWTEFKTNIGQKITSPLAELLSDLNKANQYVKDIQTATKELSTVRNQQRIDERAVTKQAQELYRAMTGEKNAWRMPEWKPGDLHVSMAEVPPKDEALYQSLREDVRLTLEKRARWAHYQQIGEQVVREFEGKFPGADFEIRTRGQAKDLITINEDYLAEKQRQQDRYFVAYKARQDQIAASEERARQESIRRWTEVGYTMEHSISAAANNIAWDFKNAGEYATNMVRQISQEISRVMIFQPLTQSLLRSFGVPGYGGAPPAMQTNEPLVSYSKQRQHGGFIPETGWYKLHKGETVDPPAAKLATAATNDNRIGTIKQGSANASPISLNVQVINQGQQVRVTGQEMTNDGSQIFAKIFIGDMNSGGPMRRKLESLGLGGH